MDMYSDLEDDERGLGEFLGFITPSDTPTKKPTLENPNKFEEKGKSNLTKEDLLHSLGEEIFERLHEYTRKKKQQIDGKAPAIDDNIIPTMDLGEGSMRNDQTQNNDENHEHQIEAYSETTRDARKKVLITPEKRKIIELESKIIKLEVDNERQKEELLKVYKSITNKEEEFKMKCANMEEELKFLKEEGPKWSEKTWIDARSNTISTCLGGGHEESSLYPTKQVMKNIFRELMRINSEHEVAFSKKFEIEYRGMRRGISNRRSKMAVIIRNSTLEHLKIYTTNISNLVGDERRIAQESMKERSRRYYQNNLDNGSTCCKFHFENGKPFYNEGFVVGMGEAYKHAGFKIREAMQKPIKLSMEQLCFACLTVNNALMNPGDVTMSNDSRQNVNGMRIWRDYIENLTRIINLLPADDGYISFGLVKFNSLGNA